MRLTSESRCTAVVALSRRLGRPSPSRTWPPLPLSRSVTEKKERVGPPLLLLPVMRSSRGHTAYACTWPQHRLLPLLWYAQQQHYRLPQASGTRRSRLPPRSDNIPVSQQCHVKVIRRNTKSFTLSLSPRRHNTTYFFRETIFSQTRRYSGVGRLRIVDTLRWQQ